MRPERGERFGGVAAGSGGGRKPKGEKGKDGEGRPGYRAARAVRWREEEAGEAARGTRACAGAARSCGVAWAPRWLGEKKALE